MAGNLSDENLPLFFFRGRNRDYNDKKEKEDFNMKNYHIEARLLSNGVRVTTKVQANSAEEAELAAGRKFLEAGFKGNQIKISSVEG